MVNDLLNSICSGIRRDGRFMIGIIFTLALVVAISIFIMIMFLRGARDE